MAEVAQSFGKVADLSKDKKTKQNSLVYELGGGTFDVSLLTVDNSVLRLLQLMVILILVVRTLTTCHAALHQDL